MGWLTRATSIVVTIAALGLLGLLVYRQMPKTVIDGSFVTYAKFRDGSRITKGSPVVIAGVSIGKVSEITIEGTFARFDMRLREGIIVPSDSFVTRRQDSLFGDSYVEIIPPQPEAGETPAPALESGEPLIHVIEGATTDAVLRTVDRQLPRMENALDTLHEYMVNGRKIVVGPTAEKVDNADTWLANGNIERPLAKAQGAMVRLENLTERGARATASLPRELDQKMRSLEDSLVRARRSIGETKTGLVNAMADARGGIDRANETFRDAAQVMAAVNNAEGEDWKGTLGRAINSPRTADDIEDATDSLRDGVGSFNRFKAWLGSRIEVNVYARAIRFYATAEIRARTDKIYLVEVERGPLGAAPTDQLAEIAGTDSYLRSQEIRDRLRFTAQFGKQMGPFVVRGGIKDSTFGVGTDLLLNNGRLKFSADVFGGFTRMPRVKVSAALAVFRSVYILAGVDDAFTDPGYLDINPGIDQTVPSQFDQVRYGRDYFIGGALHFDDADLAVLLRMYGALLISSLVR